MKAVGSALTTCDSELYIYYGDIPESPIRHSFLITKIQCINRRSTFFTQKRFFSIQLIYFGPIDKLGKENPKDKLGVVDSLSPFLNAFILKVGNRVLTFDVDVGEADKQLSIVLDFKFNDSIVIIDQEHEIIENISLNEEAIS